MKMGRHCVYQSCPKLYEDYYVNQVGHGLPVFTGGGHRGHGFGNLLAGIGRAVVPLLKRGGKALLKEGARTGFRVAKDVLTGQRVGSSLKRRAGQAGARLLGQAVSSVTSQARKRIKTSRASSGKQSQQRRRTRRPQKKPAAKDIFG